MHEAGFLISQLYLDINCDLGHCENQASGEAHEAFLLLDEDRADALSVLQPCRNHAAGAAAARP
mgnify:CR=1 FL=1